MTTRTHLTGRNPRGNALVEFVLVLPILLLLLLGALDWGFYFMIRETVINATREGARIGSVAPNQAQARTDALNAVHLYLTNAFGATYSAAAVDGTVLIVDVGIPAGATASAVSVTLQNFPVVPGRPGTSLTGYRAFTRVPITINSASQMRLESP